MLGKCERWAVLYTHDHMPVDGCVFTQKPAAEKALKSLKNPDKYRVIKISIVPVRSGA